MSLDEKTPVHFQINNQIHTILFMFCKHCFSPFKKNKKNKSTCPRSIKDKICIIKSVTMYLI